MRDESSKELETTNSEEAQVELEGVQHREELGEHQSPESVDAPTQRYAGFWMRFWAYLLDLIIIWSIGGIVVFPLFRSLEISTSTTYMFAPATIATTIVMFAYFILMTKYFKQTLGKMVFGLRVVDLKNEELSWKTILFREGIGRYIATAFAPLTFVVYLVAAFTKKKQGVHDLFADTSVIHEQ